MITAIKEQSKRNISPIIMLNVFRSVQIYQSGNKTPVHSSCNMQPKSEKMNTHTEFVATAQSFS